MANILVIIVFIVSIGFSAIFYKADSNILPLIENSKIAQWLVSAVQSIGNTNADQYDAENENTYTDSKNTESFENAENAINTTNNTTKPDMSVKKETVENENAVVEYSHGYLSKPTININRVSYWVRGNSRDELCDQIDSDEREIDDEHIELGNIKYSMAYTYTIIHNAKGYTIGDYTISTNSTITVPQWESSGGADDDTREDWTRFKNEVVAHENRHQEILEEYTYKLISTLNNLAYYSSEDGADKAINTNFENNFVELKKAQDTFDDNEDGGYFTDFCENNY